MTELPKPKTKYDVILENANGNAGDAFIIALGASFGWSGELFGSNNPEFNNVTKIYNDAMSEIRSRDYSSMEDYIDSLSKLVDFYEELARNYRTELEMYGAEFYETGEVKSFDPESEPYDAGFKDGVESVKESGDD